MSAPDYIYIDGNGVGQAMHRATKLTYGGMQVQAIYGFARTLRDTRTAAPNAKIVVLWDGHAQHRFDLFPDYKVARTDKRASDPVEAANYEAYQKQKPIIYKMLSLLGIPQIRHPRLEADDLAGILSARAVASGARVLLTTGDTDWLQLVRPGVEWYDPRDGGKKITVQNFFQETSYEDGRAFLEGKALQGDTTDSIPPVGGIGGKGAAVLLAQYKSVQGLFDAVKGGHVPDAPRYKKAFATFAASEEARANFDRNMKLMNLIDARMVPMPEGSEPLVNNGSFNPESVQTLFGRLGFVSLLKDFPTWVQPFAPATQEEIA